jgi:hypothetical protein
MFDGARNWATQGVINYFEIFFRRDSGFVQQPHQLGLAIPLRSIASRLCGALCS